MNEIRLCLLALVLTLGACETLKSDAPEEKEEQARPTSLAEIDTSNLPEKYTPGMRPVVVYYVDDPSNSQFTFSDEIGDYRVSLFPDHHYSFSATAKDKSRSSAREGLWKWHRVGPDQGFLMLDHRQWFLGFTSLEEAKATTKGDRRSFMLKFSRM